MNRCSHCGDPCPKGFEHCLHCHSWNDLAECFFGSSGVDEYRLHRALAYLRGRYNKVESADSLLRKLLRRVAELEYEMNLQ